MTYFCTFNGCKNKAVSRGLCNEHLKHLQNSRFRKNQKYRGWETFKKSYLRSGICVKCGGVATELHHIIPVANGGLHEVNNIMELCQSCHRKIHEGSL